MLVALAPLLRGSKLVPAAFSNLEPEHVSNEPREADTPTRHSQSIFYFPRFVDW